MIADEFRVSGFDLCVLMLGAISSVSKSQFIDGSDLMLSKCRMLISTPYEALTVVAEHPVLSLTNIEDDFSCEKAIDIFKDRWVFLALNSVLHQIIIIFPYLMKNAGG